jgi:galactokinase
LRKYLIRNQSIFFSAAGRVNLIGEHIDYCGGQVLPAALSLKCRVAVRKNGTNLMRITATTIDARAEIDLTNTDAYRDLAWGNYQAGVADELKKAGYNLGSAKLTIYEKTSHDAWTKTFENKEVWEWLLAHKSKYQETKSAYDNVKDFG